MSSKKLLSLLLAFCMIVSMLPTHIFAAEGEEVVSEAEDTVGGTTEESTDSGETGSGYPALELDVPATAEITTE